MKEMRRHEWSLGQEDPPEEEMATHTSILAWEIPWTEETSRLRSMGLQALDTTEQPKNEKKQEYSGKWRARVSFFCG